MIFLKRKLTDGVTAEIELDEDTLLYATCQKCGAAVEATEDIVENFSEYLYGCCYLICERCAAKRERHD